MIDTNSPFKIITYSKVQVFEKAKLKLKQAQEGLRQWNLDSVYKSLLDAYNEIASKAFS